MNEDHINRNQYSVCGRVESNNLTHHTTLSCCCNLCIENRMGYNFQIKLSVRSFKKKQTTKNLCSVYTQRQTDWYQRWRMSEPIIRNEMLMCEEAVYVLKNNNNKTKKASSVQRSEFMF